MKSWERVSAEEFARASDVVQEALLDDARDAWFVAGDDDGFVALTPAEVDVVTEQAKQRRAHGFEDLVKVMQAVTLLKQPPRHPDFAEIMAGRAVAFVPAPGGDVRREPIVQGRE